MYEKIKNDILGKKYSLSIALISAKKSREINKKYRNIDKPANVLSFSLHKNVGELILCKSVIRKELKKFNRTFEQLLGFLVIHGMLHLKGMEHSSRMEIAENKYDQKYFYRNRHGIHHHKSRSGRVFKRRKKS
ncbi:MAG: rRNA maturation RNase YbeY [Patescibacteria group bacterium]